MSCKGDKGLVLKKAVNALKTEKFNKENSKNNSKFESAVSIPKLMDQMCRLVQAHHQTECFNRLVQARHQTECFNRYFREYEAIFRIVFHY